MTICCCEKRSVANCTHGPEHQALIQILDAIRFSDFIRLVLLFFVFSCVCVFFIHCCCCLPNFFFFSSSSCSTKLRLYHVIDVLTNFPGRNRFYHDPFTTIFMAHTRPQNGDLETLNMYTIYTFNSYSIWICCQCQHNFQAHAHTHTQTQTHTYRDPSWIS